MKKNNNSIGCGTVAAIFVLIMIIKKYWFVFVMIAGLVFAIWWYKQYKTKINSQNDNNKKKTNDKPEESKPNLIVEQKVNTPITDSKSAPVAYTDSKHHTEETTVKIIDRNLFDFVVFDIETTGLSKQSDEIIQISAIKVHQDKIVDEFNHYVKPTEEIPEKIVYLTGITNSDVQNAPSISKVMPLFSEFVGQLPLLGHNIVKFDLPFIINNGFYRDKIEALDTLMLARKTKFPDPIKDNKLPTLKKYFGIVAPSHNAIKDCETNMIVYQRLRDKSLNTVHAPVTDQTHELDKLRFAITGEFIGMNRDELAELITAHGGRVTKSVSKATDFLLDGTQISKRLTDGMHSVKEITAKEIEQSGGKIRFINLDDLNSMINKS